MKSVAIILSTIVICISFLNSTICISDNKKQQLLWGTDVGISYVSINQDYWTSDHNGSQIFVEQLNISGRGYVHQIASHYANDQLFWFDPSGEAIIYLATNLLLNRNYTSSIVRFHEQCSSQVFK